MILNSYAEFHIKNIYFEGSSKANKLAHFGYSKEKRTDCSLVTLALMLDSSGFPKCSRVFEGNVSEPATLKKMIKHMERKKVSPEIFKPSKATIVMDAGSATADNIEWLKKMSTLRLS